MDGVRKGSRELEICASMQEKVLCRKSTLKRKMCWCSVQVSHGPVKTPPFCPVHSSPTSALIYHYGKVRCLRISFFSLRFSIFPIFSFPLHDDTRGTDLWDVCGKCVTCMKGYSCASVGCLCSVFIPYFIHVGRVSGPIATTPGVVMDAR